MRYHATEVDVLTDGPDGPVWEPEPDGLILTVPDDEVADLGTRAPWLFAEAADEGGLTLFVHGDRVFLRPAGAFGERDGAQPLYRVRRMRAAPSREAKGKGTVTGTVRQEQHPADPVAEARDERSAAMIGLRDTATQIARFRGGNGNVGGTTDPLPDLEAQEALYHSRVQAAESRLHALGELLPGDPPQLGDRPWRPTAVTIADTAAPETVAEPAPEHLAAPVAAPTGHTLRPTAADRGAYEYELVNTDTGAVVGSGLASARDHGVLRLTDPGNAAVFREYGPDGRLLAEALAFADGDATAIARIEYGRRNAPARVLSRGVEAEWTYRPKPLGKGFRLSEPDGGRTFEFDRAGKLLKVSGAAAAPPTATAPRTADAETISAGHLRVIRANGEIFEFMSEVVAGSFTGRRGTDGRLLPTLSAAARRNLHDAVNTFRQLAQNLRGATDADGPMTLYRAVRIDPALRAAAHFDEMLPASASYSFAAARDWIRANGHDPAGYVIFKIAVPEQHPKVALSYPDGHQPVEGEPRPVNQHQSEVVLGPGRLSVTGSATVEGVHVIDVVPREFERAELESLFFPPRDTGATETEPPHQERADQEERVVAAQEQPSSAERSRAARARHKRHRARANRAVRRVARPVPPPSPEPDSELDPVPPPPPAPPGPWYTEIGALGEYTVSGLTLPADVAAPGVAVRGALRIPADFAEGAAVAEAVERAVSALLTPPPESTDEARRQAWQHEHLRAGRFLEVGRHTVWLRPVVGALTHVPPPPTGPEGPGPREYQVNFGGPSRTSGRETKSTKALDAVFEATLNLASGHLSSLVPAAPTLTFGSTRSQSESGSSQAVSGRKLMSEGSTEFSAGLRFRVYVDGQEWESGHVVADVVRLKFPNVFSAPMQHRPDVSTRIAHTAVGNRRPPRARVMVTALDPAPYVASLQTQLIEGGLPPATVNTLTRKLMGEMLSETSVRNRERWWISSGDVSSKMAEGAGRFSSFIGDFTATAAIARLENITDEDPGAPVRLRDDLGLAFSRNRGRGLIGGAALNVLFDFGGMHAVRNARNKLGYLAVGVSLGSEREHAAVFGSSSMNKTTLMRDTAVERYRAVVDVTIRTSSSTHRIADAMARTTAEIDVPRTEAAEFEQTVLGDVRTERLRRLDLPLRAQRQPNVEDLLLRGAALGVLPALDTVRPDALIDRHHWAPDPEEPLAVRSRTGQGFGMLLSLPGSERVYDDIIMVLRNKVAEAQGPVRRVARAAGIARRTDWSQAHRDLSVHFGTPALEGDLQVLLSGIEHSVRIDGATYDVSVQGHLGPRVEQQTYDMTVNARATGGRSVAVRRNRIKSARVFAGASLRVKIRNLLKIEAGDFGLAGQHGRNRSSALAAGEKTYRRTETVGEVRENLYRVVYEVKLRAGGRGTPVQTWYVHDEDVLARFAIPKQHRPLPAPAPALAAGPPLIPAALVDVDPPAGVALDFRQARTDGLYPVFSVIPELAEQTARLYHELNGLAWSPHRWDWPEAIRAMSTPTALQNGFDDAVSRHGWTERLADHDGWKQAVRYDLELYDTVHEKEHFEQKTVPAADGGEPVVLDGDGEVEIEWYQQSAGHLSEGRGWDTEGAVNLGFGPVFTPGKADEASHGAGEGSRSSRKAENQVALNLSGEATYKQSSLTTENAGSIDVTRTTNSGPMHAFRSSPFLRMTVQRWKDGVKGRREQSLTRTLFAPQAVEFILSERRARDLNLLAPMLPAPARPGDPVRAMIEPELSVSMSHPELLDADDVLDVLVAKLRERRVLRQPTDDIPQGRPNDLMGFLRTRFGSRALQNEFVNLRRTGVVGWYPIPKTGGVVRHLWVRVTAVPGEVTGGAPRPDAKLTVRAERLTQREQKKGTEIGGSAMVHLQGYGSTGEERFGAGLELGYSGGTERTASATKTTRDIFRIGTSDRSAEYRMELGYRVEVGVSTEPPEIARQFVQATKRTMFEAADLLAKSELGGRSMREFWYAHRPWQWLETLTERRDPASTAAVPRPNQPLAGWVRLLTPLHLTEEAPEHRRLPAASFGENPQWTSRAQLAAAAGGAALEPSPALTRAAFQRLKDSIHPNTVPAVHAMAKWATRTTVPEFRQARPLDQHQAADVPELGLDTLPGLQLSYFTGDTATRADIVNLLEHRHRIELRGKPVTIGVDILSATRVQSTTFKARRYAQEETAPANEERSGGGLGYAVQFIAGRSDEPGTRIFEAEPTYKAGSATKHAFGAEAGEIEENDKEERVGYRYYAMEVRVRIDGPQGRVTVEVPNGLYAMMPERDAIFVEREVPEIFALSDRERARQAEADAAAEADEANWIPVDSDQEADPVDRPRPEVLQSGRRAPGRSRRTASVAVPTAAVPTVAIPAPSLPSFHLDPEFPHLPSVIVGAVIIPGIYDDATARVLLDGVWQDAAGVVDWVRRSYDWQPGDARKVALLSGGASGGNRIAQNMPGFARQVAAALGTTLIISRANVVHLPNGEVRSASVDVAPHREPGIVNSSAGGDVFEEYDGYGRFRPLDRGFAESMRMLGLPVVPALRPPTRMTLRNVMTALPLQAAHPPGAAGPLALPLDAPNGRVGLSYADTRGLRFADDGFGRYWAAASAGENVPAEGMAAQLMAKPPWAWSAQPVRPYLVHIPDGVSVPWPDLERTLLADRELNRRPLADPVVLLRSHAGTGGLEEVRRVAESIGRTVWVFTRTTELVELNGKLQLLVKGDATGMTGYWTRIDPPSVVGHRKGDYPAGVVGRDRFEARIMLPTVGGGYLRAGRIRSEAVVEGSSGLPTGRAFHTQRDIRIREHFLATFAPDAALYKQWDAGADPGAPEDSARHTWQPTPTDPTKPVYVALAHGTPDAVEVPTDEGVVELSLPVFGEMLRRRPSIRALPADGQILTLACEIAQTGGTQAMSDQLGRLVIAPTTIASVPVTPEPMTATTYGLMRDALGAPGQWVGARPDPAAPRTPLAYRDIAPDVVAAYATLLPSADNAVFIAGSYDRGTGRLLVEGNSYDAVSFGQALLGSPLPLHRAAAVVLFAGGGGTGRQADIALADFAWSAASVVNRPVVVARSALLQGTDGLFRAGSAYFSQRGDLYTAARTGDDTFEAYYPDGTRRVLSEDLVPAMAQLGVSVRPSPHRPDLPTLWNHDLRIPLEAPLSAPAAATPQQQEAHARYLENYQREERAEALAAAAQAQSIITGALSSAPHGALPPAVAQRVHHARQMLARAAARAAAIPQPVGAPVVNAPATAFAPAQLRGPGRAVQNAVQSKARSAMLTERPITAQNGTPWYLTEDQWAALDSAGLVPRDAAAGPGDVVELVYRRQPELIRERLSLSEESSATDEHVMSAMRARAAEYFADHADAYVPTTIAQERRSTLISQIHQAVAGSATPAFPIGYADVAAEVVSDAFDIDVRLIDQDAVHPFGTGQDEATALVRATRADLGSTPARYLLAEPAPVPASAPAHPATEPLVAHPATEPRVAHPAATRPKSWRLPVAPHGPSYTYDLEEAANALARADQLAVLRGPDVPQHAVDEFSDALVALIKERLRAEGADRAAVTLRTGDRDLVVPGLSIAQRVANGIHTRTLFHVPDRPTPFSVCDQVSAGR